MKLAVDERKEQVREYLIKIVERANRNGSGIPDAAIYTKSSYLDAIEGESPEVQAFAVLLTCEAGSPFQTSVEDNLRIARAHSKRWAGRSVSSPLDKELFLSPFYSQWGKDVYSVMRHSSLSESVSRKLDILEVRKLLMRLIRVSLVRTNQGRTLRECSDNVTPVRGMPKVNASNLVSLPIEFPEYREYLEGLTIEEIIALCRFNWNSESCHTWETAIGVTECILGLKRTLYYESSVWRMLIEAALPVPENKTPSVLLLDVMVAGSHGVVTAEVLREYFALGNRGGVTELIELVFLLFGVECTWVLPQSANDYVVKELWKASGSAETVVSVIRDAASSNAPHTAATWKAFCDNWVELKSLDVNIALTLVD